MRLDVLAIDGLVWAAKRLRDAADAADKLAGSLFRSPTAQRAIATRTVERWAFDGKSKREYARDAERRSSAPKPRTPWQDTN